MAAIPTKIWNEPLILPARLQATQILHWRNTVLLRTRAYENQVPLVFSHPFQSLLMDEDGDIIANGKANEVVYYEVRTSPDRYEGRFKNRRPETYEEITK